MREPLLGDRIGIADTGRRGWILSLWRTPDGRLQAMVQYPGSTQPEWMDRFTFEDDAWSRSQ